MREPSRQVHLDFHTSEHIPGIGSRFRKEQWQQALQIGRVNLINVFAKCHHGWSYYPTQVGHVHPHLDFDLLGSQIAACHEIGVRAPIYFTVGWSANDAEQHPEWCLRDQEGSIVAGSWDWDAGPETPKPTFSWKSLCVGTPYHDLIRAQTEELCRLYDVDGFWYDIYQVVGGCYCEYCQRGMRERGLDPNNPDDAMQYRVDTVRAHADDLRTLIHSYHPDASVYFNGITTLDRPMNLKHRLFEVNTKNDLEDLPTTWGGYDKLPIRAKYFLKENKPAVAMSGKFHTSWGEFGGFKDPEAIRAEAATMIAFGVCCNFGDQLHPCGEMDLETYRNIGHAYAYVEQIEEYGIGGKPLASLGLWLTGSLPHDEGTARMLLEEQVDFDTVGPASDLAAYEVVVIPSQPCLSSQDAAMLQAYVEQGGKLLVLGAGALDAARQAFVLDVGARYIGPGQFDVDYTVVGDALAEGLVRSPFLNYAPALRVEPQQGTTVLAALREPYFSRTYGHYCGHQNTPYQLEDAPHPAAIRRGNVIALLHGLDELYYHHGAQVHRQLFINALRQLHTRPMIEVNLPSAGRVSLLAQPEHGRYVAHLLYAAPMQRGRCLVLEDLPALRDVQVTVRLPQTPQRAYLVPGNTPLACTVGADGAATVTVPEFSCHCAVVFE
ncbi:MAG: hypothetical protein GX552_15860 [Chloroflexi bacterium]|nr:hypothetical protein [Chloroflexota bacterium]